jgi:hypothetical protein
MKTNRPSGLRSPFVIIGASIATLGLTSWLSMIPAYADTSAQTGADLSQSPYAVLGTVESQPALFTMNQTFTMPGHEVSWQTSRLHANTTYNLVWETYAGEWKTNAEHFIGSQYTPGKNTLLKVKSDSFGNASGRFIVPSGFGDTHMVGLVDDMGNVVAAGTITVAPVATIASTTLPEGEFFHIHLDGQGIGPYTSVYQVLYDNRLTGNVTTVTTNGQTDFTIRAEGTGTHILQLVVGGVEGPYLNAAQSPIHYRPNFSFTVHVTPGHPITTSDVLPPSSSSTGGNLSTSAESGTVGSKFILSGSSLIPNHSYQLVWNTMAGSRVSGKGYDTSQIELGTALTNAFGQFNKSLIVPNDLGGPVHVIQLLDGSTVAGNTSFRIYPSLVNIPKTVAVGQEFTINLQGVGWTEFDNTYAVNYDNSAIGYVCGFNSHGDVSIELQASGTPGLHYIDLYPSIYKGQQTLPYLFGVPLLTYAKDHPGDDLPAFHVVINVLPENHSIA